MVLVGYAETLSVLAAIYLVVRGIDNIQTGLAQKKALNIEEENPEKIHLNDCN